MCIVCTLGEAAGTAVSVAVKDGTTTRNVDVGKLRRTLEQNGAVIQ